MDITNISELLKEGILPGVVLCIYLLIVKIIDNKKEFKNSKSLVDINLAILQLNSNISKLTEDVTSKNKNKSFMAIKDAFSASNNRIIEFSIKTIIYNNLIANKDTITSNLNTIIEKEFRTISYILGIYEIETIKIDSVFNSTWMEETYNNVIDIVYNETLDSNTKITNLVTQINYSSENYIMGITNTI